MAGTIIGSAAETHAFTPSEERKKSKEMQRTYFLAAPTPFLDLSYQGKLQAELATAAAQLGVERISPRAQTGMIELLREGVDVAVVPADRPKLHKIIDRFAEAVAKNAAKIPPKLRADYSQIEAAVSRGYPAYRHAAEDYAIALEIIPTCVVRRYVVAFKNGPELERDRDGLTDACMAKIPLLHRLELYAFFNTLSGPDGQQAKNSD